MQVWLQGNAPPGPPGGGSNALQRVIERLEAGYVRSTPPCVQILHCTVLYCTILSVSTCLS